jgi:preprotein translocase subunit SecG
LSIGGLKRTLDALIILWILLTILLIIVWKKLVKHNPIIEEIINEENPLLANETKIN